MDKLEFIKFKQVLESKNMQGSMKDLWYVWNISKIIDYLVLIKDYKNVDSYIKDVNTCTLLSFLQKRYSREEIDRITHSAFKKDGYVYHITHTSNLESILDKGILTLNDGYNSDVYQDCIKVNDCYRNMEKRNKIISVDDLINIPFYDDLFEERFKSVYLSCNLYNSFRLNYGREGGELFRQFLKRLSTDLNDKFLYGENKDKQETRDRLISDINSSKLDFTQKEINLILTFFDKYFDIPKSGLDDKTIIMVPISKVADLNGNDSYINYHYNLHNLLSTDVNFYHNMENCKDITHTASIDPDGLIAVSYNKNDNKIKVLKR